MQSPDYFNVCATLNKVLVLKNFFGYQHAKSGNGYAGGGFYKLLSKQDREHLINELKKTLEKNQKYKFKMYVSLADSSKIGINNIEAKVFEHNPKSYGNDLSAFQQNGTYIKMNTNNIIKDQKKWIELNGEIIAKGEEKYIGIGNFKADSNTYYTIVNAKAPNDYAYYYIDDVSLYEMIIPQDISITSLSFLNVCQDSIAVKVVNSGDSVLDFTTTPLTLDLQLKQGNNVIQSLQKTINDNQYNPNAPQALEADSGFMVYFSSLNYPNANANYTINVKAQMQEDGNSLNNEIDTTFSPALSVGQVSVSDSLICEGDDVVLQYNNVKGIAVWQFSKNQQQWEDIGSSNNISFTPKQSGFFRLVVCGYLYSDTLKVLLISPPIMKKEFKFCKPGKQLLQIEPTASVDQLKWYQFTQGGNALHSGFTYHTTILHTDTFYLESIKDGCVSKKRGMLTIIIGGCEFGIPNIFTPNGDGINDVFQIQNAYGEEITTKIYNRWGNKVATFKDNVGWDGGDFPEGTYYYVIESDGEVYRGSVRLVR